jgi:Xaa-Pro aminopeptidase
MTDNIKPRLALALDEAGIDALFIAKPVNQRYIDGFTGGECYMIASKEKFFLLADSRYTEWAASECRESEVVPHGGTYGTMPEVAAKIIGDSGLTKIGFEDDILSWSLSEKISEAISKTGAKLVPAPSLVERIRSRKSGGEARRIAAACEIADKALESVMSLIKPGVSEFDIKTELDYKMKTGGADDVSFETIVLFGARTSMPHAISRKDALLKAGDFALIDFGALYDGYHSDMTRTFVCGRASDEQKAVYNAVLKAQLAAIEELAAGVNGRDLCDKATRIIREAGFPPFSHSLGHGVGLEIHEFPSLRSGRDEYLAADMTVTIEPGSYKPDRGGVRIEDSALITDGGNRILTHFTKELTEL